MASRLDKAFAPFEGTREPRLVALFRIAFFTGLGLHFFPALLRLDDAYGRGSLRTEEWNHWLYVHFQKVPHRELRTLAVLTMVACVAGVVGLRPRIAALVAGAGCYIFASFNGLHVQTLAIVDAWALLLLWMICGGGAGAWSVDAALRRKVVREDRLLANLILFQILLAVFFSGVEKLLAGWPGSNEMRVILSYPKGFMVRDWVAASPWLHGGFVSTLLTYLTLAVELGAPVLMLFKRTRVWALLVYQLFFLGIIAMLEVPPLFYFSFAFGALLCLDDAEVGWVMQRLGRRYSD